MTPEPCFFRSPAAFRRWLERHHARENELWVGLYKKHAAARGLTYADATLEALCFGWIDGVMRRIDADTHMQRFTPRRPGSIWSNVNVAHVERLTRAGRMAPAGLAAFAARSAKMTGVYSFEQKRPTALLPAAEKEFRTHPAAWAHFSQEPPWYRRFIAHKIATAKQEATRTRWLTKAIVAAAAGKRVK